MKDKNKLAQHTRIRVVQHGLETEGLLEYSQADGKFVIVMPDSGMFIYPQEMRMLVTDWMLKLIRLDPDGMPRLILDAPATKARPTAPAKPAAGNNPARPPAPNPPPAP